MTPNEKTLAACTYLAKRYIDSVFEIDWAEVENPAALVEAFAECLGFGKELKP